MRHSAISALRRAGGRIAAAWRPVGDVVAPPPFRGYRPTPRRLLNLYLNRLEHRSVRTRLWSRPYKLVIEPANACNLRCPYCFTGAGGAGRARSLLPRPLYRALLDELGPYLFELEAFNWGEPLLHPELPAMLAEATARGISTKVNTNFSLPFDAARAERLVAAGLTTLTVSIDGARQATYERYRVRGELATVLANCRLVAAAKRRLGSPTPILNWEFHVFPDNAADHDAVRALAAELGMNLLVFKGAVPGADWDLERRWAYCVDPQVMPCASLWAVAVVNNDGGVAPCNGTFYREDDMGTLAVPAPGARGAGFAAVWNGPPFRAARRFYRRRAGSPAERAQVCFDCPQTVVHERWTRHRAAGGAADSFAVGFTTNDAWNYFWTRRPRRSAPPPG